jgi:hypothetical protein
LVALLGARELRLISLWHPSLLSLLVEAMRRDWSVLLDMLPDRRRARELERLGSCECRAIWPRLRLISCWADGPAVLGARALAADFPGVEIQSKGLLATEAVVTFPFGGVRPLALRSHFFEFLEEGGGVRFAWELEEGREYSVVVSTGGGLYRYRMRDRVRVVGFAGATPCLEFLGKEQGICDLRGEKLSDGFVAAAVSKAFESCGCGVAFAMLVLEFPDGVPGYTLFLQPEVGEISDTLVGALEEQLRQNPHYRHCVELGQLAPARVERVPPGAFERYTAWQLERGMRLGQIKPRALECHEEVARVLRGGRS